MCAICKGGDGVCCGAYGAAVAIEEIPLIEGQTDIPIDWEREENVFILKGVNGYCPLLGPDGCTIQDKPLSCYIWPWYPRADGSWLMRMTCKYWWKLDELDFQDMKRVFESKKHLWRNYL
jgi:Fe-S-cluster containining protein